MNTAFGLIDWTIIAAYLVANVALGHLLGRQVRSAKDFQLGTRTAPWWALGISVVATYVSALSFLGGPAWAYGDGMAALAIHVNYPLVVFVVVVVFLPFFFNSGVASIYEYLERRFGIASRTVMAGLFLLTQTITTASILTATAVTISFATGLGPRTSIVLMTVATLYYTMRGGMNAVIWTDVLQAIVLFVGAGIVLWKAIEFVSPMSGALRDLAAAGRLDPINTTLDFSVAPTIWAGVFAMTLFHITVYGANQMMVQRALAARSIGDAKKSYLTMGFAGFFIYFLFFFIGALLYVHFKGEPFEQPNEIILLFAQQLAIPGLMGIIVAAVLAASMSSLSAAFNSLATITITDFYQRFFRPDGSDAHYLSASRAFTALWAIAAMPIAFAFIDSGGSILERMSQVSSYFVGAQLAMFALGFFSKHTTERGLLVGVVAGFLVLYCVTSGIPFSDWQPPPIAWPWYVVIGGAVNIVVSWAASLLLGGRRPEWHEQTVPGQIHRFRSQGLPEKSDGWYVVPGRVDPACWALLGFFFVTLAFLAAFAAFGAAA